MSHTDAHNISHSVFRHLLGNEPAMMCVEGVDTMKDDPTAVDILFAKVFLTDKSNRSKLYEHFLYIRIC